MRRHIIYFFIFLLIAHITFSEEAENENTIVEEPVEKDLSSLLSEKSMLLLSMSTEEYPVTPGDIYKLVYSSANNPVSHEIIVESDFTINLSVFGKINAENITFTELKRLVEEKISQAYPESTPSIMILSNGLFHVYIKGEVKKADYVTVWGLSRLSQVVFEQLTPYSSIRDIEILSRDGRSRRFDLFKAQRFGEKEQDPYLNPGDTIIVLKSNREVEITGEVKRPGKYQLLPAEGLKELIEHYGDGFTGLAQTSRVTLQRVITENDKIAESYSLDLTQRDYEQGIDLNHLDRVFVPKKTESLPIVYLEGAIQRGGETEEKVALEENTSSKLIIPFKEGDTVYNILLPRKDFIFPAADLSNAFLYRRGAASVIAIDLERLLYNYDQSQDVKLAAYDHIIIPFRQFFITVTGGVQSPGQYPYVPEKNYQYYINLAGGIDPDRGSKRVTITDRSNKQRDIYVLLEPEDRIYVPYSFSYYFLKYFPVVMTSISTLLSILSATGAL